MFSVSSWGEGSISLRTGGDGVRLKNFRTGGLPIWWEEVTFAGGGGGVSILLHGMFFC